MVLCCDLTSIDFSPGLGEPATSTPLPGRLDSSAYGCIVPLGSKSSLWMNSSLSVDYINGTALDRHRHGITSITSTAQLTFSSVVNTVFVAVMFPCVLLTMDNFRFISRHYNLTSSVTDSLVDLGHVMLSNCVVNRRLDLDSLLFDSIRPRKGRLRRAIKMIMLILLAQGVEPNPGPGRLNFGCLNIRSAVHKAALVHDLIDENNLDVLALSETWVVDEDPPAIKSDIAPPGYGILHTERHGATVSNRGGGLALIFRNNIDIKRYPAGLIKDAPVTFEYQMFELRLGKLRTMLVNIYRPPAGGLARFCDELSNFLTVVLARSGDRLLMCGDFNCAGHSNNDINCDLSSLLDSFDLSQHIHDPTRGDNILDLLITTSSSSIASNVEIRECNEISDHRMISCSLESVSSGSSTKQSSYRNIKKLDLDLFRSEILASPVFQSPAEAVDDYVDQIESSVSIVLDKLAPIKISQVKRTGHTVKNWISADALAAKRNRRKLERRWKRTGDVSDRTEYRGACRHANRLIRESRRKFFEDRIRASSDSKQRWSTIRQLLHPGGSQSTRRNNDNGTVHFSEILSSYFVDKIRSIKNEISK